MSAPPAWHLAAQATAAHARKARNSGAPPAGREEAAMSTASRARRRADEHSEPTASEHRRPARAGGFGFVAGVDRTGHADALRAHGADIVVSDLAELLDGANGEAAR